MILFSAGWFHSHTDIDNQNETSYLTDASPFYVILILLVIDKFSQKWQKNDRWGCTKEIMKVYISIENAEKAMKT